MTDDVVVFIDYQNVYRRARAAFHHHDVDPHWCGQIDPARLAQHLVDDSPFDRRLKQIRVYRGLPVPSRDRRGNSAARRQIAAWESDVRVKVIARPLQYPAGWPNTHQTGEAPREKGIDVALAVDLATMASRREYDVAILVSLDTDLKPSLEFVCELQRAWGKPRVEVAAWSAVGQTNGRLSVQGTRIYCHWVNETIYGQLQDRTNYAAASPSRS